MSTTVTAAPGQETARSRQGLGSQIGAFIELLILGVWLGSMIFFSFAVAPSAFAVLPSRHLAGQLVTSTIGKVEIIGLVLGTLLLLIQLATWGISGLGKAGRLLRLLALLVMMAAAAGSRFWISPVMVDLRARMGGIIDEVSASDPLRVEFDHLHKYSVSLMSTALIAGLILLFLTVRSWLMRTRYRSL
jgi:hypothetical protein